MRVNSIASLDNEGREKKRQARKAFRFFPTLLFLILLVSIPWYFQKSLIDPQFLRMPNFIKLCFLLSEMGGEKTRQREKETWTPVILEKKQLDDGVRSKV